MRPGADRAMVPVRTFGEWWLPNEARGPMRLWSLGSRRMVTSDEANGLTELGLGQTTGV